MISVSIVSHGHGRLVEDLCSDLVACGRSDLEVVLTLNVSEPIPRVTRSTNLNVQIVENTHPRGYGENHNAAFEISHGDSFCVLNPDIRIPQDPFDELVAALAADRTGVVAPRILSPEGTVENNARSFPTLATLLRKLFRRSPPLDYGTPTHTFSPDWVAGMFMLFRRDAFEAVRGFSNDYFLYYEDVDVCRRVRALGYGVRCVPTVEITHLAQRSSWRHPRYAYWHLRSMNRFLRGS